MKPMVYVETTVPSFYCSSRSELLPQVRRTREWWDSERHEYECYVSAVVLDELSAGDYPSKSACLDLVRELPLLEITEKVIEIAEVYQRERLMPLPPVRDALHLALASYYCMDYLLTWNCQHLANANKFRHLEVLNTRLGLDVPLLVTPDLLRPVREPEEEQ
ncbi:MAG: type II toxin-antitoxin system VapC family toxin [Planctomycetes bacterium]|nr:type II toxin-antitoxin system VapC family toxin [Planctomycetota bacterium]